MQSPFQQAKQYAPLTPGCPNSNIIVAGEEHGISSKLRPKSRESRENSSFKSSPCKKVQKQSEIYSPMTNIFTLSKGEQQVSQVKLRRPAENKQSFLQLKSTQNFVLKDTPTKQKDKFHSDFEVISKIGEGSFGSVYKVREKLTGELFAIKQSKQQYLGNKDRKLQLEEVRKGFHIQEFGPSTLKMIQAWEESGFLFIQTEFCANGNLSDYLLQKQTVYTQNQIVQTINFNPQISPNKFSTTLSYPVCPQNSDQKDAPQKDMTIREIFIKMCISLRQIHQAGFIHFDLKPSNFLVTKDGEIKLGDFGHCIEQSQINQNQELEEGDCIYMAPEILDKSLLREAGLEQITSKVDIFSLGISFLELATGLNFPQNGPIWAKLREADKFVIVQNDIDEQTQYLINMMIARNPNLRPDTDAIIKILEQKETISFHSSTQNLVILRPEEFHVKWKNYCRTQPVKRKNSDEANKTLNFLQKLKSLEYVQKADSSVKNQTMKKKLDFSQFSFRQETPKEEVSFIPNFKLDQENNLFAQSCLDQDRNIPRNLQELFMNQDQDLEMEDAQKQRKLTFGFLEQELTQTPADEELPRNPEAKDSASRLQRKLLKLSQQKEDTFMEERRSFVKPRVLF